MDEAWQPIVYEIASKCCTPEFSEFMARCHTLPVRCPGKYHESSDCHCLSRVLAMHTEAASTQSMLWQGHRLGSSFTAADASSIIAIF